MFGNWHISRRTVLRGAGAALSLPLLDVMLGPTARAAQIAASQQSAKRLAYLYIPNGVAEGAWQPEKVENGRIARLNKWMQPLAGFESDLTIFRNMWTPRGNGHIAGTATWLTGGSFDGEKLAAGGASVDQIAAKHFKATTMLPSLEMSVRGEGIFTSSLPRNTISWVDETTPAPRDIEPRAIFDRMFRTGESGLGSKSVIDLVLEDARSLKRRASDEDQKKIDEYLQSVREIERRIEYAERQKARATSVPGLKDALVRPNSGIPDDHGAYMKSMMDMIVLAFWSDSTRVATFMMDHGQSNRYFNFIDDVKGTWHALSHWKDTSGKTEDDDGKTSWSSRAEKKAMYNRVTTWHTQQVAYLLKRLSDIKEPNGRLLDNSMIVYGSSLADGHEHSERNLPLLLAGGSNASIKAGRVIGGRRHASMSDLHLALLQRLGVRQDRFADSDSATALG